MRIIGKEERHDRFSHDTIYHLSCLSSIQDVKDMLSWLESENLNLQEFSLNYNYDHADFRIPQRFEQKNELLDALKGIDLSWLSSIIVIMSKGTDSVYACMNPNNDTVRVSHPIKK